ncbi:MAG: phage tail assembly protein [Commensalibacter sp.]
MNDIIKEKTKIITLEEPISFNGAEYKELKLQEPTVNQISLSYQVMGNRTSVSAGIECQIDLLARVSGWPKEAIEELPSTKMDEATSWLDSFQADLVTNDLNNTSTPSPQFTINFDPPIELSNGDHFDTMDLQEPTIKHRKLACKQLDQYGQNASGMMQFEISLVTAVSKWSLTAVLAMPISKFCEAVKYLNSFFPNGHQTGLK